MNLNKRTSSRRGPVVLLVLLLITSGGLRLIAGSESIFANASEGISTAFEKPPALRSINATDSVATRTQMGDLLKTLQMREAKLKKTEEQIALRAKALNVADQEIERRIKALEKAEEKLRDTMALAGSASENDLTQLTAVYENMKPKDAAALFEAMEPEFAAGFLARMKAPSAASVMAGLSPKAAYSISVILAGRNANVPKN